MLLGEYKCIRCGRVHLRISLADAAAHIQSVNARLQPDESPASLDAFLRCFGCGAPASSFVLATEDDALDGVTLTLCVIERLQ